MLKILNTTALVTFVFALLAGCASIVSKSEYPVSISSNPQGADIEIVNRAGETVFSGKTPTTVTLSAKAGFFKGENYTVAFSRDDCVPHTAQIERTVDGWYAAGNIVFGGLIGWLIVDPATGSMWTLKNLHADLNKITSTAPKEGVHIVTLENIPEKLRSKLVKLN